ncbi:sulfotransferase [Pontibacter diazotrophicus]|uniref:sulfotransferase n=1 Tax=Pontibacter diazotrophicus TaxID=1400979 RepID=UPI001FE5E847
MQDFGFKMTKKVRHHENETLFWAKATSILRLPQQKLHRSKLPYSYDKAFESLQKFVSENELGNLTSGNVTREEIFNLYSRLIQQNQPRFVEKSPHHLFNKSNLDLISEYISLHKNDIDFKVIGLVRHPLSVIYSGWDRWKFDCRLFENEWYTSNQNLLHYQKELDIEIVRYEDLVAENGAFMQEKLNLEPVSNNFHFRSSSLYKWKTDDKFGHELSDETKQLAANFGYSDFETPYNNLSWKIKEMATYAGVEIKRLLRSNDVA